MLVVVVPVLPGRETDIKQIQNDDNTVTLLLSAGGCVSLGVGGAVSRLSQTRSVAAVARIILWS